MQNLAGNVFGEWTVISHATGSFWLCRCSCGNERTISTSQFKAGHSTKCRSCGTKTHGKSRTLIHRIWNGMMMRCTNPNNSAYHRYGGRGITVCESWKTFSNFYADMGDPPEGMSLDRINNDGNYEPSNCRWATDKQQSRNRRTSHFYTVGDKTATIAEWAEFKGMPPRQLRLRIITKNLTMEQALAMPYKPYKRPIQEN